jgi:hypothetical protein
VSLRRGAVLLAALLALGLGACGGGDDGSAGDATQLLERGFATDVDSGRLALELEVDLRGVAALGGPVRLELDGPFRSRGPTRMPDVDMTFEASLAGQSFDGRLVLLPDGAWVEHGGETYEVGEQLWGRVQDSLEAEEGRPDTFAQAGLDPLHWIEGAETGEEREVGGVRATEVSGELDVARMLRDVNRILARESGAVPESALDDVDDYFGSVDFTAWIGEDDIWRRVQAEADFEVPEAERDSAGGLSGGHISLDVRLDQPNEPVEIEGLGAGRPLAELLTKLGIPPESLLGPGFAAPEPG